MKLPLVIVSLLFLVSNCKPEKLHEQALKYFKPLPKNFNDSVRPELENLGHILFFEKRVSIDGTVSCATCHPMDKYGADGLPTAIGNNRKPNPRNSPTVINAALQFAQHWRGDRVDVEDQAIKSLTGKAAFGAPSAKFVEDKLKSIKEYQQLFKAAFPRDNEPINVQNFAKAIGAWERTLAVPSPFDKFLAGDENALSSKQEKGLQEFITAGCVSCHNGSLIGGGMFQKFGVKDDYWKYTHSQKIDIGREDVTKKETDKYIFKVAMLRNVAMTSPYFHDGSVADLHEAIKIMAKVQLGKDLSVDSIDNIYEFLQSLTSTLSNKVTETPKMP